MDGCSRRPYNGDVKVPDLLKSKRLVLRRHLPKDLDAFAEFLTHPAATAYMAFTPEQRTVAGAQQLLEYAIGSYDTNEPIFSLTIADHHSDTYLGSCGLNPIEGEDGVEIYYTVLPAHQNQGLATEAIETLIAHLFETTDIRRVVAYVIPENVPSVRVAEKLGFVDDGAVERQAQTAGLLHETTASRRYVLER